jgi:uncharacterized protein
MKEEKVFFPSAGIQLEGLLNIQEASSFKGGVVFCHPHPQYGGDMHNPVITVALDAAAQEGFATLRFNFRGVGESGGSYGDGMGETDDVKTAVEYINLRLKNSDHSSAFAGDTGFIRGVTLILVGYSFGAWVGLPIAVESTRIKGMVAVAPPLEMYDFGFVKGCKKKKLFIAGSRDLYCPTPLLERWYQEVEEPKSLTIIPGADHFFFSHSRSLIPPLREFFRRF